MIVIEKVKHRCWKCGRAQTLLFAWEDPPGWPVWSCWRRSHWLIKP